MNLHHSDGTPFFWSRADCVEERETVCAIGEVVWREVHTVAKVYEERFGKLVQIVFRYSDEDVRHDPADLLMVKIFHTDP